MSISLEKYSGYDRITIKKHGMVMYGYIKHIVENDVICIVNNLINRLDDEAKEEISYQDHKVDYETISYWIVSRRFANFLVDMGRPVSNIDEVYIWHKTNGNTMEESPMIIQFAQSWIR